MGIQQQFKKRVFIWSAAMVTIALSLRNQMSVSGKWNWIISGFMMSGLQFAGCNEAERQDAVHIGKSEASIRLDSSLLGVTTLASNLDVPWEITWGPDNRIWFTEQGGTISRLDVTTGKIEKLLDIPGVWRNRSAGLLGMVVQRDGNGKIYAYVDYTCKKDTLITSRLVRYRLEKDTLLEPLLLLEIPGNTAHNGSRVTIGPDSCLYWATGDAYNSANAQNLHSLNGKILRLHTDGRIPADNPIAGSYVWAWGFRNMQGLAFDSYGNLFSSEHGDANDDEVNLLKAGKNYGWPQATSFEAPLKKWTPTIAPAGIAWYSSAAIPEWQNSLLLVTLKAQSLRVLFPDSSNTKVVRELTFLENRIGRIRDVCVSPDGTVYLSTSNRDWNPAAGYPKPADDRIIRIASTRIQAGEVWGNDTASGASSSPGRQLYIQYCSSCHKPGGNGVPGSIPSLQTSTLLKGPKTKLAALLVNGKAQMPSFAFLSDIELAQVINYIRSSWSRSADSMLIKDIQEVRK